ncbi:MAG TPA: MBL fold metallo-hydrolase [Acidimicrobiales bacterium]|nr:MBL fold metallo-hydrolase [Acidimicrobiales bacterium]
MTELTFLGTGNFQAEGRYWNSFVLDGTVMVEPAPTVLPHLRRCGLPVAGIEVVVISHFHADHVFGWPFFLLDAAHSGHGRTLHVVGPPGVERHLQEMIELGAVQVVGELARSELDLRFVEVDGTWQDAGPLRFRAVEVVHVPHLRCFGYLLQWGSQVIGYSGDTTPCSGLSELAHHSDVLVLECNGSHPEGLVPVTHMDEAAVRALRSRHPDLPLVLTHLGGNVDASGMEGVVVPEDFDRLTV